MEIEQLKSHVTQLRRDILIMTNHAKNGHVGGSLSEIDILAVLYHNVMNIDPQDPDWPDRDRFLLSKGHASPGFYAILADRDYFDKTELKTFDETGTRLQAHPDMRKCPGVDYSTGALGQGLSVGIGMALGAAARGKNFVTFVLIGDGETQEGQVWEALMYAGVKRVKNLVAIFDNNGVQLSSTMLDNVDINPLAPKLSYFGWKVMQVNGHDVGELEQKLLEARIASAERPVAVVAKTVKGKGVSFMENKYAWHGKAPNDEELEKALNELDEELEKALNELEEK